MSRRPEATARRYGKVFDEIAADTTVTVRLILKISSTRPFRSPGSGAVIMCLRSGAERSADPCPYRPGPARHGRRTRRTPFAVARRNLDGAGAVEFVNAQFEDAPLPPSSFRLFSASAFHWVDPEVSWQKAADVLVPAGRSPSCSTSGLRSRGARKIRRQYSLP